MWILPALLLSIKKLGDDPRHPMKPFEPFEPFEPGRILKINYLLRFGDFVAQSLPATIYLIKKLFPMLR